MALVTEQTSTSYAPQGSQTLTWEELYEGKRSKLKKNTNTLTNNPFGKSGSSSEIVDAELTPEIIKAIASNNEFKAKQQSLLKQGSGLTQSILGGRGY